MLANAQGQQSKRSARLKPGGLSDQMSSKRAADCADGFFDAYCELRRLTFWGRLTDCFSTGLTGVLPFAPGLSAAGRSTEATLGLMLSLDCSRGPDGVRTGAALERLLICEDACCCIETLMVFRLVLQCQCKVRVKPEVGAALGKPGKPTRTIQPTVLAPVGSLFISGVSQQYRRARLEVMGPPWPG